MDKKYEEKDNGVKIGSKCEWNEFGETFSKFFLNLEKQHALLNQVRALLCSEKEVTDECKNTFKSNKYSHSFGRTVSDL